MKLIILQTIGILVVFYMILVIFIFFNQRNMLYFPDSTDFYGCSFEGYEPITHNTTRMYFYKGGPETIIVYHGNAGSVCDRAHYIKYFDEKYSVLFLEYAGYSGDTRSTSKKLILNDVKNVINFMSENNLSPYLIIGESLGSGVASYHAKLDEPEKLLFITAFDSLANVAKGHYWYLPVKTLLRDNYDSSTWLENFSGKIKIIHGDRDSVIPLYHSQNLFNSLKTEDKELVVIRGAGHNDLFHLLEVDQAITAFIS